MAHLQLDLLLTETGYKKEKDQRFRVYLTNSLEESHPATGTLFASWLSQEASEANSIKRDTPVMCILGNPPYAVSSSNASKDSDGKKTWIGNLIDDYKKDLNERKINLDDDYIKFIRYGQHFIEKNGEGILAYISNNSFIDGITHRQMRKHLLETFDKIYILDLHGSAKKNETAIDGGKDENVFDIMSGVSINLFIKTNKKRKNDLARVFNFDLFGKRNIKYDFLASNTIDKISWINLDYKPPYYFFVEKDFSAKLKYDKSFRLSELFNILSVGVETQRDSICVQFEKSTIEKIVADFKVLNQDELRNKYNIKRDGRDWKIETAKKDITQAGKYVRMFYRPFDIRMTYYTGRSKGFMAYPRGKIMDNLFQKDNISMIICKQQSTFDFQHVFVTNYISDGNSISIQTKERASVFPLYLYETNDTLFNEAQRKPNLNPDIIKEIASKLNLTFTPEKESDKTTFAPIDIFDYIYAVLHSPTYREKYKEFLKIDFPRVPYPKDSRTFWALVDLGGQIRQIHLLESPTVEQSAVSYPQDGDNVITRKMTKNSIGFDLTNEADQTGKVWINDEQYFEGVPLSAYNFYIGGYQPAQKWLKDRHGRELSFDDIMHYRKIIKALSETERLMNEIDKIGIE